MKRFWRKFLLTLVLALGPSVQVYSQATLPMTEISGNSKYYGTNSSGAKGYFDLTGASLPDTSNIIAGAGDGSGDGADTGIDPATVVTTGNIGSTAAYTFPLSVLNYTPVNISTVLSGSTYTLVPGTLYYGSITGNKTFAFSPALTSADAPIRWVGQVTGTGTWTVPTLIREGASGSTPSVSVGSTGYFTVAFSKDGAGNIRMVDTIPQALVTSDLPTDARIKAIVGEFDGGGSVLTTGDTGIPLTVKYAGTIVGYCISADTGTCTIKTWKKAAGTAIPTVSDVISTSGVALSSGTSTGVVTTTSDFTTTTITSGDHIMFALTAVSSATKIIVTLYVQI